MAETAGLVHQVVIGDITGNEIITCVVVGPAPNNTEVLVVVRRDSDGDSEGAFKNSIVDAAVGAMLTHREIVAVHPDDSAEITALRLEQV